MTAFHAKGYGEQAGSFTPELLSVSGQNVIPYGVSNVTYSTQAGEWRKFGSFLYFHAHVNATINIKETGYFGIGLLPFPAAASMARQTVGIVYAQGTAFPWGNADLVQFNFYIDAGKDYFFVKEVKKASGSLLALNNDDLNTGSARIELAGIIMT